MLFINSLPLISSSAGMVQVLLEEQLNAKARELVLLFKWLNTIILLGIMLLNQRKSYTQKDANPLKVAWIQPVHGR
nr:MAG TPA: hypothetical protein [Caudoviricetes sp.]